MQTIGKSIVDVSRRAGVSVATVSRVINNNPRVSAHAVGAVRRAMAELQYTPPPPERRYRRRPLGARKAAGVVHGNVAMLFPDSRDKALRTSLSGRFMHGLNEGLTGRGLGMIVTPLLPDGQLPVCVAQRQVDGVIIRGATDVSEVSDAIRRLGSAGDQLPVVWLMTTTPRVPAVGDQVMEDVAMVGQAAATYLVGQGCEQVLVVNHFPSHPSYAGRLQAFIDSARDMGVSVHVINEQAEMSDLTGRVVDELRAMHGAGKGGVGVFVPTPDDEITVVYRAIREAGMVIGRDVHFVGCSYDPARLATLDPSLANVDVRPEAIASAAAELLLWRLTHAGEPRRRLMIEPRLVRAGE